VTPQAQPRSETAPVVTAQPSPPPSRALSPAVVQNPSPAGAAPATGAAGNAPHNAIETGASAAPARRKDQDRALKAYEWANAAKTCKCLDDYETAVQGFAAALLRSGFAVAASTLERDRQRKAQALLIEHLASWQLPGIPVSSEKWPAEVRKISDVSQYMQASRELVALLGWLRRACRAVQVDDGP
jgi:hypothetical protein